MTQTTLTTDDLLRAISDLFDRAEAEPDKYPLLPPGEMNSYLDWLGRVLGEYQGRPITIPPEFAGKGLVDLLYAYLEEAARRERGPVSRLIFDQWLAPESA